MIEKARNLIMDISGCIPKHINKKTTTFDQEQSELPAGRRNI